MNAAFNHGLFANPKSRRGASVIEHAYLPLGTEITIDRLAANADKPVIRQVHTGDRLVIWSYANAGTPRHRRIGVTFVTPKFFQHAMNENMSSFGMGDEGFWDKRPSNRRPALSKYIELGNLQDLRVRDVQRHIVATSDEFEHHMTGRDLVRHGEKGRSFRPSIATLWKNAGQAMTVALCQNSSAIRKISNDIAPVLFTELHKAQPSRAKTDAPLPPEYFHMTIVSINAPRF